MSPAVSDYGYQGTVSGAGSSFLKLTFITHSKVFVIQPDHRAQLFVHSKFHHFGNIDRMISFHIPEGAFDTAFYIGETSCDEGGLYDIASLSLHPEFLEFIDLVAVKASEFSCQILLAIGNHVDRKLL